MVIGSGHRGGVQILNIMVERRSVRAVPTTTINLPFCIHFRRTYT